MTRLSYWDKRYLRIKAQELQNTANYESNLKSRLSGLEYELEQEMNVWYSKYADNHDIDPDIARKLLKTVGSTDWTMTLEEFKQKAIKGGYTKELDSEYFKSRIARLQDLESQLKEISSRFASNETDSLSNRLADQFQETYMATIFNTQIQKGKLTSDFARFNEDQIKYIVNQPWHKEDFSKRIWKNYHDELPNQLVDVMLRGTFMGYSPQRITRMFQQRFEGIRRHQIHRLVITEMGHIAEQSTSKAYEESGIEKYQYMATLESHTCDVCAHLDGEIFKMSDKKDGINYPLIHPHCRCTTIPYIEGLPDVKERWVRDPITGKGKTVKNLTYKEWYKQVSKINDDIKFNQVRTIMGKYSPSRDEYELIKDTDGFKNDFKRIKYIRESVKEDKNIANRDKVVDAYISFKNDGISITGHASIQYMYRMRQKNGRLMYNYHSIKNICSKPVNYIDSRNNRPIRYYDKIAVVKENGEDLIVTLIRQRKTGKWWKSIEEE